MQMLVMHKKPMQSGPLQKNSKCKFGANAILYNAMLGSANVANVIQSLQSWNQPKIHLSEFSFFTKFTFLKSQF